MLQTDQKTISAVLLGIFRRRIQDAAKWSMIEIFVTKATAYSR